MKMKIINVTKIVFVLFLLFATTTKLYSQANDSESNLSVVSGSSVGISRGVILNITLPISGKSSHAIIRAIDRAAADMRKLELSGKGNESDKVVGGSAGVKNSGVAELSPTIILQFNVSADQDIYGRGSSFGVCYEIAKLLTSEKLNGIRTVSYFPQSVKGHVLLVALACDERAAAGKAELGEVASGDEVITKAEREAYFEISRKRLAVPKAAVEKMLDSSVVLMRVETERGLRLILSDEADSLSKTESFVDSPSVMVAAGEPGIFTAEAARKINLISWIADDRIELARGLGFRPDDIKSTPIPGEVGHAIRIDINGTINYDKVGVAMRMIQSAVEPKRAVSSNREFGSDKVGFICVVIDSAGGDLASSINFAMFLADDEFRDILKVAYIPFQARSDAALIALACDEVVLGQGAVLGGDGNAEFSKNEVEDAKVTIREIFSKATLRSWSIPVGFIDREAEIFKMTRTRQPVITDYFCDEEHQALSDSVDWVRGDCVKRSGELFKVIGGEGEQYVVDRHANDFSEFRLLYGLEDDPFLVEPSWADKLVAILSSPGMSMFILFVVFIALAYDVTGLGIGAFIAVVGICLFFWLNFLGGTAGWLEVILFVVGVLCVVVEIFLLPGLGIFGIGGAIAIITSLVFATQTFYIPRNSYQFAQARNSMLILFISSVGVIVCGVMLVRAISKLSKPNDTKQINEREKLVNYDYLSGMEGKTITPLVPAGRAIIDNKPINVVSDGDLIESGERIRVLEVVGNRVVVSKL
jgi:membrane-bound ClpP family serine protease